MYTFILVGLGGFIGAILRYFIAGWIQNSFIEFPLGTLTVNVIGSFFIGLIMSLSEYQGLFRAETRIFLTIGILGSFTTLSTFSYESFKLLENSDFRLLTVYLLATVFISLFAVYLGRAVAFIVMQHL